MSGSLSTQVAPSGARTGTGASGGGDCARGGAAAAATAAAAAVVADPGTPIAGSRPQSLAIAPWFGLCSSSGPSEGGRSPSAAAPPGPSAHSSVRPESSFLGSPSARICACVTCCCCCPLSNPACAVSAPQPDELTRWSELSVSDSRWWESEDMGIPVSEGELK